MSTEASDELPNSIDGLLYRIASELTCPICLQLFTDATSTPCGHTYCSECIQQSLKARRFCPICKQEVNRRNLIKATSAELLAKEFQNMREAYEGENGVDLSQQAIDLTKWRADPISDLSQKIPYPTKPSSTSDSNKTKDNRSESSQPQASHHTNSVATYDSDATFVTSLEVRQAQEDKRTLEAPESCAAQSHHAGRTASSSQTPIDADETTDSASAHSSATTIVYLGDVSRAKDYLVKFRTVAGLRITDVLSEATHFVANVVTNHNRLVDRRIDYLQAVLRGIIIVSHVWIIDCANAGVVVPVDSYLVKGDRETGPLGAQFMIRKRQERGRGPLFHDTKFWLNGEFSGPTRAEIESLISLAGGRVISSADPLRFASNMIVPQETTRQEATKLERKFGKRPISAQWILDSISNGRKLETVKYIAGHVSAQTPAT